MVSAHFGSLPCWKHVFVASLCAGLAMGEFSEARYEYKHLEWAAIRDEV